MTIKMYDLAAAEDDRRFSPYCWRIKMVLAHKGLKVETIPWRFHEKEAIAFSGQGLVPVLVDGERVVHDSWEIALTLDEAYPGEPRLFEGHQSKALAFFFKHWCEQTVHLPIFRATILDLYANLHAKDREYFRTSRENRFGQTLEQFGADREGALKALRTALGPLRPVLKEQPFVSGRLPAFSDYALFGAFQWARAMSPVQLLAGDDPVHAWRERMLDLYGGLARSAKGYPV